MRLIAPSHDQVLQATAHHEAGHAVIAYRFRKWIRDDITVDPSGNGIVPCKPEVQPYNAEWYRAQGGAMWRSYETKVEREIIISLAGPLAEGRYLLGRSPSGILLGGTQDLENVQMWMRSLGSNTSGLYARMLHDRTRRMLRERRTWGALKELAVMLIKSGSVSAETAEDLFSQWRVPRITKKAWVCGVPHASIANASVPEQVCAWEPGNCAT